jgi:hypothetical protein
MNGTNSQENELSRRHSFRRDAPASFTAARQGVEGKGQKRKPNAENGAGGNNGVLPLNEIPRPYPNN